MTIRAMILLMPLVAATVGAQAPVPTKAAIVSAAGCLEEAAPTEWRLVRATDPTPSHANAPVAKDLPALPVAGKHTFKLIGVGIFDLPSYKGHTVVIKGLLIKDEPISRLNVTSVTSVAATCSK